MAVADQLPRARSSILLARAAAAAAAAVSFLTVQPTSSYTPIPAAASSSPNPAAGAFCFGQSRAAMQGEDRRHNIHLGSQKLMLKASGQQEATSDEPIGAECGDAAKERFRGRNILLTGASGGLGRALAMQFARCGASNLILSGRDENALKEVATECKFAAASNSLSVMAVTCDLSDPDSVEKLGDEAIRICAPDAVDVLVNNGGLSSRSRFLDTKVDVDELLMRVNFLSGSALAKKVVPGMVEKAEGAVIWISSVQGLVGIPSRTSYAASKFAVQGYCEALRGELASSGVTVHVPSPGYIRTNLSKSAVLGDGAKYGKMDDTTANGADPNDVAVEILDSVAARKADFTVAAGLSARAAIWLRFLAPSLLNKMLVKRYDKSQS